MPIALIHTLVHIAAMQVTGWFNLLGQWAVTAGIDFTLASFLSTIILCGTGGANGGGWVASQSQVCCRGLPGDGCLCCW